MASTPTSCTAGAAWSVLQAAAFVPLQLPAPAATVDAPAPPAPAQDICIELHRGTTTVKVTWPTAAAGECATWLRELLR
jgi:transposase